MPTPPPVPCAITALDARALGAAIRSRALSCVEVMDAYLDRTDAVDPPFNSIVSRQPRERLIEQARAHDALLSRGECLGPLHGFPLAIKDMAATAGIRTTQGSTLLADHVPAEDGWMVARMKRAGAIVVGKTNTPEFGLGSHTFNRVFGATGNAWDPTRSAGGSSGGSAVSIALHLQPLADGSDFMGSLRNPAAFNHVFGLRPSAGRVPNGPLGDQFVAQLGTEGPMARTVRDLALLLSVQAGRDDRAPLSIAESGEAFAQPLEADPRGTRIAWLADLDGYLPMEPGILDVCAAALHRLEALGCAVDAMRFGTPPEPVWQTWLTWRRWLVAGRLAPYWTDPAKRAQLKPEAQWEASQGDGLTGADVYAASLARTAFHRHLVSLFERVDVLALPAAQVWPFDLTLHWPKAIAGVTMDTYHRWMEVVIYATLAGLPAISVPAGFNTDGLPMGIQLIGRPHGELALLRLAAAYEDANADLLARRPWSAPESIHEGRR